MNFGRPGANLTFNTLMPFGLLLNDGHGLIKDDGGLPTWCAGVVVDLGDEDATGVTVTISMRPTESGGNALQQAHAKDPVVFY